MRPSMGDLLELARWFASSEQPRNSRQRVPPWSLIVWSDHGELRARRTPDQDPEAIFLDGRKYRPYPRGLPDETSFNGLFWGALRGLDGRLVGFDVHFVEEAPIL